MTHYGRHGWTLRQLLTYLGGLGAIVLLCGLVGTIVRHDLRIFAVTFGVFAALAGASVAAYGVIVGGLVAIAKLLGALIRRFRRREERVPAARVVRSDETR